MDHKKILFKQLKIDIDNNPPILTNIIKLLEQFINGLCMFCPSKTELNKEIKNSFPSKIEPSDTLNIIDKLIYWIEQFQSPADDKITRNMYPKSYDNESIIQFLSEFYDHTEKVYKDTWDARKRLVNGENIVPPEHRKIIKGKNGIPDNIKSGF